MYSMLRMEWIEGTTLNQFISAHISDGAATDGDPMKIAREIMEMSTSDGTVLL